MAGALDTRARATAERMISRYGKAMTLRVVTANNSTYNPATGNATVDDDDEYDVVGVLGRPSREAVRRGARETDDAVLLAASAVTVTPKGGDILIFDSVERRVTDVLKTYSGQLVALYELIARVE